MKVSLNYTTRKLIVLNQIRGYNQEHLIDDIEFTFPSELVGFNIALVFAQRDNTPISATTLATPWSSGIITYSIPGGLTIYNHIQYQILAAHPSTQQVWKSNIGHIYFDEPLPDHGDIPFTELSPYPDWVAAIEDAQEATNAAWAATNAAWIATNAAIEAISEIGNISFEHFTNYSNPHQTTYDQVGADAAGTASILITNHALELNPHSQYATDVDLINILTGATSFNMLSLSSTTPIVVSDPGQLSWNQVDGTLDLRLLNQTTLQMGQEIHVYGKAVGNIQNGDVVQFVSVQGNHLTIKKAVPAEIKVNPNYILGVATQNILNGNFGYVTWFGKVNDVFTTGLTAGQIIYFDSVNGGITNQMPPAPNPKIRLGTTIKEATGNSENGIFFVRVTFSPMLEQLQNVDISNPLDNHVLAFNNSAKRWENKQIETGGSSSVISVNSSISLSLVQTIVLTNATSGQIILSLPQASTASGKIYKIKKTDNSENTIIVDGYSSETIDGEQTYQIKFQYQAIELVCDGLKWYIV